MLDVGERSQSGETGSLDLARVQNVCLLRVAVITGVEVGSSLRPIAYTTVHRSPTVSPSEGGRHLAGHNLASCHAPRFKFKHASANRSSGSVVSTQPSVLSGNTAGREQRGREAAWPVRVVHEHILRTAMPSCQYLHQCLCGLGHPHDL
ncbi:unnamed protein product [Gadus morhua 'NCC']